MIKNDMLYSVTIIYIRQSRVSIEKVHRVVKFNQEASLKSSIDMNAELKKMQNNLLWKRFLKVNE